MSSWQRVCKDQGHKEHGQVLYRQISAFVLDMGSPSIERSMIFGTVFVDCRCPTAGCTLGPRAGLLQDFRNFPVATPSGQCQGRRALGIRQIDVGTRVDQIAHDLLMPRAAVTQHDRLDERRPAQVVDVIERRPPRDQSAHHLDVPEMSGGDERRR